MYVVRQFFLMWTPGALMWCVGLLYWNLQPGKSGFQESERSAFYGATIITTIVWPLSAFIAAVYATGRYGLIWPFYRGPLKLWAWMQQRRDDKLMRQLRDNPSLLEKVGEVLARDPAHGLDDQLWQIPFRGPGESMYVLRVKDRSTGEIYIIRVPPSAVRADRYSSASFESAVAWTFSRKKGTYAPSVMT